MTWLTYLFAILAGAANPAQSGANAQLNKSLEQPLIAAVVVYGTGLLGVLLVSCFTLGSLGATMQKAADVPWWGWLGGILSIGSTVAGLMLAKQLGSAVFTGITVTTGLVASLILDHFGWLGFKPHALGLGRAIGAALMILGLLIVSRT